MTDLTEVISSAVEAVAAGLGVGAAGGAREAAPRPESPPAAVSHVADFYKRYPGETVTFHTRVTVDRPAASFAVQVSLPASVTLGDYSASASHIGLPEIVPLDSGRYLIWRLDRDVQAGDRFDFSVQATVAPAAEDYTLTSTAMLLGEGWQAAESVEVAVRAKSSYLRYLPALYYDDELMGRFLMIFESLWSPIEGQIDTLPYYFDPRITPSEFVPWLATWSDLELDERWTEDQQRRLLASAARLYRMRGTKRGLVEYLHIYTGRRAVITEHRANNLRLGRESKFGPSVALGRGNRPHSFTVYLRLPRIEAGENDDETTLQRKKNDRERTIRSIIESEKPAHTTYTLVIEEE